MNKLDVCAAMSILFQTFLGKRNGHHVKLTRQHSMVSERGTQGFRQRNTNTTNYWLHKMNWIMNRNRAPFKIRDHPSGGMGSSRAPRRETKGYRQALGNCKKKYRRISMMATFEIRSRYPILSRSIFSRLHFLIRRPFLPVTICNDLHR